MKEAFTGILFGLLISTSFIIVNMANNNIDKKENRMKEIEHKIDRLEIEIKHDIWKLKEDIRDIKKQVNDNHISLLKILFDKFSQELNVIHKQLEAEKNAK